MTSYFSQSNNMNSISCVPDPYLSNYNKMPGLCSCALSERAWYRYSQRNHFIANEGEGMNSRSLPGHFGSS